MVYIALINLLYHVSYRLEYKKFSVFIIYLT